MKILTKMLAILLCIGLIISCAACGKEENNSPPKNTVVSGSEGSENDNSDSDDVVLSEDTSSITDNSSTVSGSVSENEEQKTESVNSNNTTSSETTSSDNNTNVPKDNIVEKPNHTHSYKSTKVSPTCTANGYTKHACACGSTYTDSVKSALGHNWGSWVTTKEPTTTSTGTKKRICSRCSVSETGTINVLELSQAEFDELVCKYTLQYINDFREEEGANRLTELTRKGKQFAELRSEQIVDNFEHDIDDMRAAATQLEYGRHVIESEKKWDPIKQESYYTGKILDYYTDYGAEAIGKLSGIYPKKDEYAKTLANRIATMFKNSSGHWSYLGSSQYDYGVVGAHFDGWFWYIAVIVHISNEYD